MSKIKWSYYKMAKHNDENLIESTYEELTEFENFFVNNWKTIIVCGGLIVVLVVLGLQSKSLYEKYNLKAASVLSSAETVEEIESALKKYPYHKTADFARLRLAALYFSNQNYDKSLALLEIIFKKAKVPALSAQAALNYATVLAETGKLAESAEKYSEIAQNKKYPFEFRLRARISGAILYNKLGKNSLAKNLLDLDTEEERNQARNHTEYQKIYNLLSTI
mgnify:CR=1 FL=1